MFSMLLYNLLCKWSLILTLLGCNLTAFKKLTVNFIKKLNDDRKKSNTIISDDEIFEFLNEGNRCSSVVMQHVRNVLSDDHVKMLNLGHDWIESYLPFILQKVSRVHFGLLQQHDIDQLELDGVKIPTSRKLTAVPFVAKDVPSRSSEVLMDSVRK